MPGHWEGDLLSGGKNSHIATLVERQRRYVMLVHVAGKNTAIVVDALVRQVQQLPSELMASLTWDRGMGARTTGGSQLPPMLPCPSANPKPLAAWQQRKHQRSVAAVLPQGRGSIWLQPDRPRHRCPPAQCKAKGNSWLPNAGRYGGPSRCVDRLNPTRPTSPETRYEVLFCCEAPRDLAGLVDQRGARCVSLEVLVAGTPVQLCRKRSHLWRPAGLARRAGPRLDAGHRIERLMRQEGRHSTLGYLGPVDYEAILTSCPPNRQQLTALMRNHRVHFHRSTSQQLTSRITRHNFGLGSTTCSVCPQFVPLQK